MADEIDALEGRALNEAVAERVLGWERFEGDAIPEEHRHRHEEGRQIVWMGYAPHYQRMACSMCGDMPDFSGEYNGTKDTWQVVENLSDRGWQVVIDTGIGDRYMVKIKPARRKVYADWHRNAAVAICRAALRAVAHHRD